MRSISLSALAITGALCALAALDCGPALAQGTGYSGGTINLGGRGWGAPPEIKQEPSTNQIETEVRAGFTTDYMYRGTTLSDHKPAVGAAFEAAFSHFYAGATFASVKLPTQPAAEISMTGGFRQKLAGIDFDLGATYYMYPGEMAGSPGINYWEAALRADKKITDSLHVGGGFAYSPNVSNTGAWSWYAAAGLGYDFPSTALPYDITASFTGAAGYSWFGNQSPEFGSFALPSYLNWQAGVTFTRKMFNLDLRYYDTNLSKENCFVLTGDPNASPGGVINPVTNPDGLTSRWCGATFVAKAWFVLN